MDLNQKDEKPSEERADELAKCFEDDKNGYIPHPSEYIAEPVIHRPLETPILTKVNPEPVNPVPSSSVPLKSNVTVTPTRQVLPKKPVVHPVSAMSYQQRRQMYNTSRPGHSLPNPLLNIKSSRPVTTKQTVVVGSNRLASTTRPAVSALRPVASERPAVPVVNSVKSEHPSATRQPGSIHPTTSIHPTSPTHHISSLHTTQSHTSTSTSKVTSTPPITRLARNASSLPNYMRDTAASRAKQTTIPVSTSSQRSTTVSSLLSSYF